VKLRIQVKKISHPWIHFHSPAFPDRSRVANPDLIFIPRNTTAPREKDEDARILRVSPVSGVKNIIHFWYLAVVFGLLSGLTMAWAIVSVINQASAIIWQTAVLGGIATLGLALLAGRLHGKGLNQMKDARGQNGIGISPVDGPSTSERW